MSLDIPDDHRATLQALYATVDRRVAEAGPACALSGRCCRFREYGHTLFLTEIEARLLLADAPPPVRPLDDAAACPWQDEHGRCTARDARPLGCRIYFCDPTYPALMYELTEAALAELRAWVRREDLPWNYRPLHDHLQSAARAGYPFAGGGLALDTPEPRHN
jgi:hypothetical protein